MSYPIPNVRSAAFIRAKNSTFASITNEYYPVENQQTWVIRSMTLYNNSAIFTDESAAIYLRSNSDVNLVIFAVVRTVEDVLPTVYVRNDCSIVVQPGDSIWFEAAPDGWDATVDGFVYQGPGPTYVEW